MTASVHLGDYEAESEEAAAELAENDSKADWIPTLCYQCASDVELSEVHDVQVVKQND